jgi:hypothetical protein
MILENLDPYNFSDRFKQRQDVKNWCRHCDICASKKHPNKKPHAPLQQYNVGASLERIAVDILGPSWAGPI